MFLVKIEKRCFSIALHLSEKTGLMWQALDQYIELYSPWLLGMLDQSCAADMQEVFPYRNRESNLQKEKTHLLPPGRLLLHAVSGGRQVAQHAFGHFEIDSNIPVAGITETCFRQTALHPLIITKRFTK